MLSPATKGGGPPCHFPQDAKLHSHLRRQLLLPSLLRIQAANFKSLRPSIYAHSLLNTQTPSNKHFAIEKIVASSFNNEKTQDS